MGTGTCVSIQSSSSVDCGHDPIDRRPRHQRRTRRPSAPPSSGRCRPTSPTSSASSTSTAARTPRRASTRSAVDGERLRVLGATVDPPPERRGPRRHGHRRASRARTRRARRSCASATWTRSSTRGPRPSARSPVADGIATGPGVTDMKSGLLAGLYAIAALRELPGGLPLGAARLRREPGRGDRVAGVARRTSGGSPPRPTRASSSSARASTATSSAPARASSSFEITVHGPRVARGRRAREGAQRDPRGGPDRDRAAGAQRALAGRDRQRRHDPGRDAAQRGRRRVRRWRSTSAR